MKLVVMLCLSPLATAQSPAFDLASVTPAERVSTSEIPINRCITEHTRFTCRSLSLKRLIEIAYDVLPSQVSGPRWIASELYDIAAKPPAEATPEQINECLRRLLIDRFALQVRHKPSTQVIYALLAPHGAESLQPSTEKPPDPANESRRGASAQKMISSGRSAMGIRISDRHMTMSALAHTLADSLDQPVHNMTGITGAFIIDLQFAIETGLAAPNGVSSPTVFEALRRQLGLKLEARRGEVDAIVVEEALKKPRDND
jgi:uncharacterized protein (TIGR03435 family)